MRAGLTALAVILGACFSPSLPAISCQEGVCPAGMVCNDDAQCVPRGTADPDAAAPDSAADAPIDGAIAPLIDRGLLGRWFIDEASSGTDISTLTNAVSGGAELEVVYGEGTSFVDVSGHRGLAILAGNGGGAATPIDSTNLSALDGAGEATVELVLQFDINSNPFLLEVTNSIELTITGQLDARLRVDSGEARWRLDVPTRGVLHLVFDSAQTDPVAMYLDGVELTAQSQSIPSGLPVGIDNGATLVFGNNTALGRGLDGVLYYAAIYQAALSPAEIATNAELLERRDDR